MAERHCIDFVTANLRREEVAGKRVLEVGALDVSGLEQPLRPAVEALEPETYLAVDIEPGPDVDEICDAAQLRERYGDESFDVVISTEMLEHVRDWRTVVSNLKHVVKSGGVLLFTTRSYGFPYHGWPHDYWRYEPTDVETIFSDMRIEVLARDTNKPGVWVKLVKPDGFTEVDLTDIALFSMVKQRRTLDISRRDERVFAVAYTPVRLARRWLPQRLRNAVRRTPLSRERRVVRSYDDRNSDVDSPG
jgi:SAM-dependent methyltransferase